RDPRPPGAGTGTAGRVTRSTAAGRSTLVRPGGRGALHARDRPAHPQRAPQCDRVRGRAAQAGGDRRLLAGTGGQAHGGAVRGDRGGMKKAAVRRSGGRAVSKGHAKRVRLLELAHARSGDKGDTANVGLIALKPEYYPILVKQVTAARVARHFKGMIKGPVERYELPNLRALNFLLHGALDGGGTISLKTDAQGKVFSTALLRMEVEVSR